MIKKYAIGAIVHILDAEIRYRYRYFIATYVWTRTSGI